MIPFEANLDDIYSVYFESTNAGHALSFISSGIDDVGFVGALSDSPIFVVAGSAGEWRKDSDLNSAIAEMICGFSVLELAAMTGFISMASFSSDSGVTASLFHARQGFIRRAKKALESKVVRDISESNSPFPVAQLFWLRICGHGGHS